MVPSVLDANPQAASEAADDLQGDGVLAVLGEVVEHQLIVGGLVVAVLEAGDQPIAQLEARREGRVPQLERTRAEPEAVVVVEVLGARPDRKGVGQVEGDVACQPVPLGVGGGPP